VTQGDVVATVGNQAPVGVSVGYHLHFEVRVSGVTPVDPYGNGDSNILWEDEP
jgi:murein DD-endopeptidase MepM/ murein hydrolase activator NlpD